MTKEKEEMTKEKEEKGQEKKLWIIVGIVVIIVLVICFVTYNNGVLSKATSIQKIKNEYDAGASYEYTTSEEASDGSTFETTFQKDTNDNMYLHDSYYLESLGYEDFYNIENILYGCTETSCSEISYSDKDSSKLDLTAQDEGVASLINYTYDTLINGVEGVTLEEQENEIVLSSKIDAPETSEAAGAEIGDSNIEIYNNELKITQTSSIEYEGFTYNSEGTVEFKKIPLIELPSEVV